MKTTRAALAWLKRLEQFRGYPPRARMAIGLGPPPLPSPTYLAGVLGDLATAAPQSELYRDARRRVIRMGANARQWIESFETARDALSERQA